MEHPSRIDPAEERREITEEVQDEIVQEDVHQLADPIDESHQTIDEDGPATEFILPERPIDEPMDVEMVAPHVEEPSTTDQFVDTSTPPLESPTGSDTVGVSRAGRKRKANSRYQEEPSPVLKPASAPKRKSSVVAPPVKKQAAVMEKPAAAVESAVIPSGPPTFGHALFGRKGSADFSEDLDEDEILPEESVDDVVDEPVEVVHESVSSPPVVAALAGIYEASGLFGRLVPESATRVVSLIPANPVGSLVFPNMLRTDPDGVVRRVHDTDRKMFSQFSGGPLGLIPSTPVHWLRDEVPKLSAYFRKKLQESGHPIVDKPAKSSVPSVPADKLSEHERAERRRRKEEERRRIIEERARRRERERLKQLYRQHWLALTKFPIDDNVLHSRKGIRRLGPAPSQCRHIVQPAIFWDCQLGPPGTLLVPENVSDSTTALLDELFVIWNVVNQFKSVVSTSVEIYLSLPTLVRGVIVQDTSPVIAKLHVLLLEGLWPYLKHTVQSLLSAEQQYELQLVKNRGRAKLFWPTFSEFRDFLFLGNCVIENVNVDSGNWLWISIWAAKCIVLLDPVDSRRDFLASVSSSFEEVDFESKWLFDLELRAKNCGEISFPDRVRLLKLLTDKLVSLPWMKKLVDMFCDARVHISSELVVIEKEERKISQRITVAQRVKSIMEEQGGEIESSTSAELQSDIELRNAILDAKRKANLFVDKCLGLRIDVIGRDRYLNEYFQVSSERQVIFVRQHAVSHPNVIRYGMYDSLANIEGLIQSLDDRGVREHGLKQEVQKIKANIYAEMVSKGEEDYTKPSIDWLHEAEVSAGTTAYTIPVGSSAESQSLLGPLAECVSIAQSAVEQIKVTWLGYGKEDDDATVDENMIEEEEVSAQMILAPEKFGFKPENEAFFESLTVLADTFSECIHRSLFGHITIDETPSTCSSIIVQFHIKSGFDLFRQVNIPATQADCDRGAPLSQYLDGLLALDEIVHDELARHKPAVQLELWPVSGGEKHAWRKFLHIRLEGETPDEVLPGEEEEVERPTTPSGLASFSCENCGKEFKFHILLGIHKLHPCKTRGRKPFPVEPTMEVSPPGETNGMVAIEKLSLPVFPPPPSSRQQQNSGEESAPAVGGTTFICDICGKSFPHNQGLAVHQTRWCIPEQQAQLILTAQQAVGGIPTETGAPVNCEVCGKPFPTAQGLSIHQTRWCKGSDDMKPDDGVKKEVTEPKTLQVTEPVFMSPAIPAEQILQVDELLDESEQDRNPGYTPAGFSHGAIAVAAVWYSNRLRDVLDQFTSASHPSRNAANRKK